MSDRDRYPSEAAERTQVRLPDGMRERLKAAAAENNRSMNAEIVARLEASFGTKIPTITFSKATTIKAYETAIDAQDMRAQLQAETIADLRHRVRVMDRALLNLSAALQSATQSNGIDIGDVLGQNAAELLREVYRREEPKE